MSFRSIRCSVVHCASDDCYAKFWSMVGKTLYKLNPSTWKNILECKGWCEEESSRLVAQAAGMNAVSISPTVVAKARRHHLPSRSKNIAALKKIFLEESWTENRSSVLVCEESKRKDPVQLCNHRCLRGRLQLCLLPTCCTGRRAVQDLLLGVLGVTLLLAGAF